MGLEVVPEPARTRPPTETYRRSRAAAGRSLRASSFGAGGALIRIVAVAPGSRVLLVREEDARGATTSERSPCAPSS